MRHPFVDIRMLRFLLAVPPLPWCRSKYLLRRAMRGTLPKEVLHRRKATPDRRSLTKYLAEFCHSEFRATAAIHDYVDPERFPNSPESVDIESELRGRSLNHWLQNLYRTSHNREERIRCDRFAREATPVA